MDFDKLIKESKEVCLVAISFYNSCMILQEMYDVTDDEDVLQKYKDNVTDLYFKLKEIM